MSDAPDTQRLAAEVEALRSALAELAVTQAESLNALAELASLVDYVSQGRSRPARGLLFPEISAAAVAAKASTAGAQALAVAQRLLQPDDS